MSMDRANRKRPKQAAPAAAAPRAVEPAAPMGPLSVEAALYLLLVGLAAATRLWALDAWPLNADEGRQALAAWESARGLRPDLSGLSALLVHGTAALFLALPSTDVIARLLPALAGVVVVGLPWWLRRGLGRGGALAASGLLAVSPSFLFFSRSLDGAIVTAAGGLGLLVCALRFAETRRGAWLGWAAVSLAVLIMADGSGWATLAFFGVAAIVCLRGERAARGWQEAFSWDSLRGPAVLLGAILVLVSTGLLTNLGGLRHGLVEPLVAWAGGAAATDMPRPWSYYVGAWLGYETLTLALAVVAALVLISRAPAEEQGGAPAIQPGLPRFLAVWVAIGLVWVSLWADKPASAILHVLLPACLLGGWVLAELAGAAKRVRLLEGGGAAFAWSLFLICLAVVAVVSPVSIFGGRFETLERQLQLVQAGIVVVLLLALGWAALHFARRLTPAAIGLSLALAAGIVLIPLYIHSAWTLAYAPKQGEPLAPEAATTEVRSLLADLLAQTRFLGETSTAVVLEPAAADPLRWYLRDFRTVSVAAISSTAKAPVVIVPAEREKAVTPLMAGYASRRYRLSAVWQDTLAPDDGLWSWLTNRARLGPVSPREVVVFTRTP